MGLAVQASAEAVRSHQRMNLSVPFSQASNAQHVGALFDVAAGVFFVPPRVPLYPFRAWLPWDIDSIPRELDGFVPASVLHAAGPTKADGSPVAFFRGVAYRKQREWD